VALGVRTTWGLLTGSRKESFVERQRLTRASQLFLSARHVVGHVLAVGVAIQELVHALPLDESGREISVLEGLPAELEPLLRLVGERHLLLLCVRELVLLGSHTSRTRQGQEREHAQSESLHRNLPAAGLRGP